MDDPWGSPWADEIRRPSPKGGVLESKTTVTPERSIGLGEVTKSPWDDDDEFGGWATLPTTGDLQTPVRDGLEEAKTVEWVTSVNDGLPRGGDHIQPDGTVWLRGEMQLTNRENLDLEIRQITGKGLSQEPSRVETTEVDKERVSDVAEETAGDTSFAYNIDRHNPRDARSTVGDGDESNTQDINISDKSRCSHNVYKTSNPTPLTSPNQDVPMSAIDNNTTNLKAEDAIQGESSASRPSSSPSDHSHHGEVFAESSRTSFEEDERRPDVESKGSSKDKEMVRLFDVLSADNTGAELAGQGEIIDDQDDHFDTPVAAQSEDDFGDFEEGISCVTKTSPMNDTGKEESGNDIDKTVPLSTVAMPASAEESEIDPSAQLPRPHDPVSFEPDLSLLGHVFKQTSDMELLNADPKHALETESIIRDSFSSTSERKVWYRISRSGTLRKHNAGDVDNYVRINWKDSKVRAETLKIVERWIEEDRIGGGLNLVSGTRLGSMFGWGQKNAAPISMAAALASKNENAAARSDRTTFSTSAGNPNAGPVPGTISDRNSFEQNSASRKSFQSPSSATEPQFSWSSGTPISSTVDMKPSVLPTSMSPSGHQQRFNDRSSLESLKESQLMRPKVSDATSTGPQMAIAHRPNRVLSNFPKPLKSFGNQMFPEAQLEDRHSEMDARGGKVSSPAVPDNPQITPLDDGSKVSGVLEHRSLGLSSIPSPMESHYIIGRRPNERMSIRRSDGSSFILPNIDDHQNELRTSLSTASRPDAWASSDLSYFDNPAPPPLVSRTVIPSPVLSTQGQGMSNEGVEQDRIVKNIIQNLPNLSYMLRR